jgi:hypothetical protein
LTYFVAAAAAAAAAAARFGVQINGNLCRHVRKPVDYLVARVKPGQLPDVLLLLVLQVCPWK